MIEKWVDRINMVCDWADRWWSIIVLVLLILVIVAGIVHRANASALPNIVLIMADDLGNGDLPNDEITTPTLDRLAEEGMTMSNYTAGSPVCGPSRVALFTGYFPWRFGSHLIYPASYELLTAEERHMQQTDSLPVGVPNIARFLQGEGYQTVHIGKWHLGEIEGSPHPSLYGYDHVWCLKCVDEAVEGWPDFPDRQYFRHRSTSVMVNKAIDFINESNKPTFVWIGLITPHSPINIPPEELLYHHLDSLTGQVSAKNYYYSAVQEMDRALEPLLSLKNTIVIFTSDNGPESIDFQSAGHSGVGSSEPYRGDKRSTLEGGVHVPFIVWWPGHIEAGRKRNAEMTAVDVRPSIASMIGRPFGDTYTDGEDLSGIFFGDPWYGRRRPILHQWRFGHVGRSIDAGRPYTARLWPWELMCDGSNGCVLYNLREDPQQLYPVVDRPDKVAQLKGVLR